MSPREMRGPSPEELGLAPKEPISEKKHSPYEQLDERWYERFKEVANFEAYDYLTGDEKYRNEQKTQFFSGNIENPTLDYPKINIELLNTKEAALLELKNDILAEEKNEVVRQAYRWKINEKIAEIRMIKSAGTGDTRWFNRWSKFVYGSPSPDVFAYSVQSLHAIIKNSLASDNEEAKKAALELQQELPSNDSSVSVTPISPETVQNAQNVTRNEFKNLIDTPEIEGDFDAEQIRAAFESALERIQVTDWNVEILPNITNISVSHEKKLVKIPATRKVEFKKLQALLTHEIGSHIIRSKNGERSKLKLLGIGLDRVEKGEEGVATMREEAIHGKLDDFMALESHLAISMVQGLDGTPRDFRQTYSFLKKYYQFKKVLKPEEVKLAVQDEAWNRTIRIFRGTDCKTPGACFTKDIVYKEGNIETWNLLEKNPNELTRFSIGKYDASNERHIWILEQLGISEADLEEIPSRT